MKGEVGMCVRWFEVEPKSGYEHYYSEGYWGKGGCGQMVMSWAGPSKSGIFRFSPALSQW